MKRLLFSFLLILSCQGLFAQDLMGKWTSVLSQNVNGNFLLELNITKLQNGVYSGTSSSTAISGPFRGKMVVTVKMKKLPDGSYSYEEGSILDSTKQTNYYWCKKIAVLAMRPIKDSLELSGQWRSLNSDCQPGSLRFARPFSSPAPEVVAEKKPEPQPPLLKPEVLQTRVVDTATVRIRGTKLNVALWDFDAIDEDSVSLKLNGKQVGPKAIMLTAFRAPGSQGSSFDLLLIKGDNVLEIKANNEGLRPYNTVALLVSDDDGSQKYYFMLKANESTVIHFLRI